MERSSAPLKPLAQSGPKLDSRDAIAAYCRAIAGSTIRSIVIPPSSKPPAPPALPSPLPLAKAVPYVDVPECARSIETTGATRAVLYELRQQRSWDRVMTVLSAHLPVVHEQVMRAAQQAGTATATLSHVETHGTVVRVACARDMTSQPLELTTVGLTQVACTLGATCDELPTGEKSVGFGPIRCEVNALLEVTPDAAPALGSCVGDLLEEPVSVVSLTPDELSVLPQLRGNIDVRFPRDGDVKLTIMTDIDGFQTGPRERFERGRLIDHCRVWSPPRRVGLDPDLIRLELWRSAPCDWEVLGVRPISKIPPPPPDAVTEIVTAGVDAPSPPLLPALATSEEELVIPALLEEHSYISSDVIEALGKVYGPREVDVICGDLDRSIDAYVADVDQARKDNHEVPGVVCPPACDGAPILQRGNEAWRYFRGNCLRGYWRSAAVVPGLDPATAREVLTDDDCLDLLKAQGGLRKRWIRSSGARSMMRHITPEAFSQGLAYVIRGVLNHYGFRDGQRFGDDYAGDLNRTMSWYELNVARRTPATGRRRGGRGPRERSAVVHPDVGPILCSVRGRMCGGDCMYCPWGHESLPDDMDDMVEDVDVRLGAPRRAACVYCYSRRPLDGETLDNFDFDPLDWDLLAKANEARWAAGYGPMPIGMLVSDAETQGSRARVLYIPNDKITDHRLQLVAVSWGYVNMASISLVLHHVMQDPGSVVNATERVFGELEAFETTD